jgi:anti-anti-sigma factor
VKVDFGNPTTVVVTGDLDLTCVPLLQKLPPAVVRRGRNVVFDMRGVTFIDCSGLTALLRFQRQAHRRGGTLGLRHVPLHVRRVIKLTGTPLPLASGSIDRVDEGRLRLAPLPQS